MSNESDNRRFAVTTAVVLAAAAVLSIGVILPFRLLTRPENREKTAERVVTVPESPSIHFPDTTIDFGTMALGEKRTIGVPFGNRGRETLRVTRVRASCACAKASAPTEEISLGETVRIGVTLEAEGKPGRQVYSIFVESNDPENPLVKLTATVTVTPDNAPCFGAQ